ncbi:ABC transporter ATP-binding protein [Blautia schinkii]|nr:ABC transporter ATP-binding protein [Blautia schinkii]
MENILELNNITKNYEAFTLNQVSFACPQGSIMGLIGPNGAGKTTIIHSILDVIKLDGGSVRIFGKDRHDLSMEEKAQIAVVYDDNCLPAYLAAKEIGKIFQRIYPNWDAQIFQEYMERLEIPQKTAVRDMSKGNKIKMNLAVALSHHPRLLILDEITSALDPLMREEILSLFLEFIEDESRSILFSSHIITDLEKIADYITFINNGQVVFSKEKDELLYNYTLVRCKASAFHEIDKNELIAYRAQESYVDILIEKESACKMPPNASLTEKPTIEEIMLILAKGEKV